MKIMTKDTESATVNAIDPPVGGGGEKTIDPPVGGGGEPS